MKLTVEQVATMTKLSTATVRLYASRKKLGTKEGNRRYFSKKDVEELTGPSSSSSRKSKAAQKGKPTGKKAVGKKAVGKKATRKRLPKAASASVTAEANSKPAMKPEPRVEKRSFWSFFRKLPKPKISLLEAKVKK